MSLEEERRKKEKDRSALHSISSYSSIEKRGKKKEEKNEIRHSEIGGGAVRKEKNRIVSAINHSYTGGKKRSSDLIGGGGREKRRRSLPFSGGKKKKGRASPLQGGRHITIGGEERKKEKEGHRTSLAMFFALCATGKGKKGKRNERLRSLYS